VTVGRNIIVANGDKGSPTTPIPMSNKSNQASTTEVAFILDRSGSMQSIAEGAINGFNSFLNDQQKDHEEYPTRLTLTLFDTVFEVPFSSLPVPEILPLDSKTYKPDGCTALLDAIGHTVDELGKRLAAMPEAERPGKVIVAILTDGLENSSTRYSWRKISQMIKHQTEVYKWEFLFLGANQDAIATASKMSIEADNSATIKCSMDGMRHNSALLARSVRSSKRGEAKPSLSIMLCEEEEADKKGKKS